MSQRMHRTYLCKAQQGPAATMQLEVSNVVEEIDFGILAGQQEQVRIVLRE